MNRGLARFIGDIFDFFADHALFFTVVGALCFLFGPSLLVVLERKGRLPRVVVWLFTFVLTPAMFLMLIFLANPQSYCNDPLPHDAFRLFYPLFLPLIPLYIHYAQAERLNHPFQYGFILVVLSAGVFTLTVAYEVLHLAYQSVQGHGIVYSGARAWECAYVNYASLYSARDTRNTVSQLFLVVQVIALVALRMRKRRQRSNEEE
ncbi:MAG: hypothetical protein ACO2Y2_06085 [Poseidonia sp.]